MGRYGLDGRWPVLFAPLRQAVRRAPRWNTAADFTPLYAHGPIANALTNALTYLNTLGIVPQINSGYRTPAEQLRMRRGASGPNPAAVVSWHQAGMAVDINGTRTTNFGIIIGVMQSYGLTWGGTFNHPDRPHFQMAPAGTSPSETT